jgi:outer membrane receptor protein involved in Fe transport
MPKSKNTSTRAFRLRSNGLLAAWLWLLPGQAAGQAAGQSSPTPPASPQGDLTTVSLEDLMNIEVTSVSKKEQRLSRTAAAVFVITQEDIRRSGATNIPDLLRMVPGMDVAQINASTWAISAWAERGIQQRAAGDDRRAQRLHTFVRRRVLGDPRSAAGRRSSI